MLRVTLKSLLARKLRLLLSGAAVVLGVAFVVGALVLTDTLGATLTRAFGTVNEAVAVDVRGAGLDGPATQRREVPADVLDRVRAVDGVAEAEPVVRTTDPARFGIVGRDGKAVATTLTAGNWIPSERLNPQRLAEGRPPRGPAEVVLDADLAERAGVRTGDRTTLLTATGQREATVVGLTRYPDGDGSLGGESYAFLDTAAARELLGVRGYTDLYVAAADGTDPAQLRDRIRAALPAGLEAVTGRELADEQADQVEQGVAFLGTFLLVFAAVALFVGTFLVVNTLSILVAQRTRELALLRALGASRVQVTASVLGEAVAVGAVAAVVGLALGVGVAAGLPALFHAFGADLPSATPVVRLRTVLAALLVGPGVTASAALLPARRAATVPPVAAMRAAATPDRPLRKRTAAGLTLAAAGAVALTGEGLPTLGAGALLVLTGVALLSPLAARPVVGGLGRLAGRSVPGSLGRQNSLRDPRRTAATAAALMIGLALVAAVGVLGASLKQSVRGDAAAALTADYVVTPTAVGIGPDAYDALTRTSGVGTVTGLRGGSARLGDRTVPVSALDPAALGRTVTLSTDRGSAELGPGTVLVADDTARERHLEIGRSVPVTWEDGERAELRVAGTYAPNQLLGDYLVDDSAAEHFARRLYVAALVDTPGDPAPVRTALDDALRPYPAVLVQDTGQFVADTAKQVDQLVRFLQLLLALSVGIALLGVANTLALSVLERTRELGLLRAVGMQRRQVKAMVQVEAVLVAVFGGLLGLVVGVGFGIALQRALADEGIRALSIPVGQLLLYVVLAAAAGVSAAWLPARRAAKLDVLRAVSAG